MNCNNLIDKAKITCFLFVPLSNIANFVKGKYKYNPMIRLKINKIKLNGVIQNKQLTLYSNYLRFMLNTENIQSLIDNEEGYNVKFKVCVPSKIRELTKDLPISVKVYLPISLLI